MGAIITLQQEIEAIIGLMDDCIYLRAKESEANIALNEMRVSDCLALHIDRTTAAGRPYRVDPVSELRRLPGRYPDPHRR